jgi:hypothetical protein
VGPGHSKWKLAHKPQLSYFPSQNTRLPATLTSVGRPAITPDLAECSLLAWRSGQQAIPLASGIKRTQTAYDRNTLLYLDFAIGK